MKPEVSDKQDLILEAAIRRFSHFGVHKTTMTEIADDVTMSKQSLSYYFPDKYCLIAAVINQIIDAYLLEVEQNCLQATSVEKGLLKLIEIKKVFFERYYMLYIQNNNVDIKLGKHEISDLRKRVKSREADLIAALLQKGVSSGELKPVDVNKTSVLLLDTLSAFECSIKVEKVIPQHTDFLEMNKKQQDVLQLFITGLKAVAA